MKKTILYITFLMSLNVHSQQWISFNEDSINSPVGNSNIVRSFFPGDSVLYVGGAFTNGGNIQLNSIGAWNNNIWDSLGSGNSGGIYATTMYKNKLYVGGGFLNASGVFNTKYIARWNGTSWETLVSFNSLGSVVYDLTVYNDTLIIATNYPGSPTRICGYDADIGNYIEVGWLPFNSTLALEVYNGELYAGGTWFTLKKYIGGTGYAAWEDVGGYLNYYIQDMTVDTFNNFLYVAGGFYAVDGSILTDNVAIWNGYYWEKVGYGYNGIGMDAFSVAIYNGDVYAGKVNVGTTGGVEYNSSLLRWDGQDWYEVGGGTNLSVFALEEFQNKLYVGGNFDTVNGLPQKAIACWLDTTPNCRYLKPRVFTINNADTFYMSSGHADAQFYNNNAYADTWSWDFGDSGTSNAKDPLHLYTQPGTYQVQVTVTHGNCTDSASKEIIVKFPAGITDINTENTCFKLYPNPTSGTLFIEFQDSFTPTKKSESVELQIIDMNGKEVLKQEVRSPKTEIDISSLAKGVYFVTFGEQKEKFVKE